MNAKHDLTVVRTTVTMVLAAGIIAETVALAGDFSRQYTYRPGADLFRAVEDSVEFSYEAGGGLINIGEIRAEALFKIDSAENLRAAFAQQGRELNTSFFLNINASLNVKEILGQMEAGLTRCRWKFDYAVDANGNRVAADYYLYMFTVEYRDDFKVLQAFRDETLIPDLTANELALKDKAEEIVAKIITPGMTEYEKVLAIHDYIILNGRYESASDDPAVRESLHKAEGILVNGAGVCSSYAGSMNLLLGMVDVESIFVTGIGRNSAGMTELHAWNKVKIGGEWYNFDVTWNDPASSNPNNISYAWFGLTDEAFSATHQWDRTVFPQVAAGTAFNYYHYNNLVAKDYTQFKSIITRELSERKNESEITVFLYVENYDLNTYSLSFIYDILPGITKASYSKPKGASGELKLKISQGG